MCLKFQLDNTLTPATVAASDVFRVLERRLGPECARFNVPVRQVLDPSRVHLDRLPNGPLGRMDVRISRTAWGCAGELIVR